MAESLNFAPGQLLADRYRVKRVLGEGGMGVVLEAVHVELDAPVAIKVLRGETALSDEATARFLREAKAASLLRSEFVARVTDFGRIEAGLPFMVMELLEGMDLERALLGGPLSITDAVDATIQVAAGLSEAHAAGIVHRDIKPSNLFRTHRPDGSTCVKIVDFGISKLFRLPGSDGPASPIRAITGESRVMGTPLYMSPEQVRSARDVDPRSDVWSLGAVLYELTTGEPPFLADDLAQLISHVLEQEPVRANVIRPDIPAGLAELLQKALTKDRERRIQSMREFAELLSPFGSSEGGIAARRASLPGGRAQAKKPVALAMTAGSEFSATLAAAEEAPRSVAISKLAGTAGAFPIEDEPSILPDSLAATRASLVDVEHGGQAVEAPVALEKPAEAPAPVPSRKGKVLAVAAVFVGIGAIALWLGRGPSEPVVGLEPSASKPSSSSGGKQGETSGQAANPLSPLVTPVASSSGPLASGGASEPSARVSVAPVSARPTTLVSSAPVAPSPPPSSPPPVKPSAAPNGRSLW